MGTIHVDRFYKKGDPSVCYDIPYAGDLFKNTPTSGSSEAVYDNELNGYVINVTPGIQADPAGLLFSNFLKSLGDLKVSDHNVFELEGADGGSIKFGNTIYSTPLLNVLKRSDSIHNTYSVSLYALSGNIIFQMVNGSFEGAYNGMPNRPKNWQSGWTFSTTLSGFFINRESIFNTLKAFVGEDETVTKKDGITDNMYYSLESFTIDGDNISGGSSGLMVYVETPPPYVQHRKYTQAQLDKFLNGVKHDDVEVDDGRGDGGTGDGSGGDEGTGKGVIPDGDDISEPDLPSKNIIGTGLLHAYVLSNDNLKKFAEWLWTDDIISYLSKLFTSNPLDSIISASLLPYTPTTLGTTSVVVGGVSCGTITDAPNVSEQFQTFTFNYDGLSDPIWGSEMDFSKGVKVELYIPFVGVVPLDTNEVVYTHLTLKYIIDNITGQGIVVLSSQKTDVTWDDARKKVVIGTWSFNCKSTVTLTRQDLSSMISGGIGTLTSLVSGNVSGAIGTIMSSRPQVEKSGSMTTSTAYLNGRKPFIIYTFSKVVIPTGLYSKTGRPQYATKKLSECSGFVRCKDPRMTFESESGLQFPTQDEIDEIYRLLEEGVVI